MKPHRPEPWGPSLAPWPPTARPISHHTLKATILETVLLSTCPVHPHCHRSPCSCLLTWPPPVPPLPLLHSAQRGLSKLRPDHIAPLLRGSRGFPSNRGCLYARHVLWWDVEASQCSLGCRSSSPHTPPKSSLPPAVTLPRVPFVGLFIEAALGGVLRCLLHTHTDPVLPSPTALSPVVILTRHPCLSFTW